MKLLKNIDFFLYTKQMSRAELARAINVSPSTLNSWYSKQNSEGAAIGTVVAIANYFDVSLDLLVLSDNIHDDYMKYLEEEGEKNTKKVAETAKEDIKKPKEESGLSEHEIATLKRLIAYGEGVSK